MSALRRARVSRRRPTECQARVKSYPSACQKSGLFGAFGYRVGLVGNILKEQATTTKWPDRSP
jgi:hypothetical protein